MLQSEWLNQLLGQLKSFGTKQAKTTRPNKPRQQDQRANYLATLYSAAMRADRQMQSLLNKYKDIYISGSATGVGGGNARGRPPPLGTKFQEKEQNSGK